MYKSSFMNPRYRQTHSCKILLCLATSFLLTVSIVDRALYAQEQSVTGATEITDASSLVDIKVEAFLSATRMSFNDTATMTLRLTWAENEFDPQERKAPNLELRRMRVGSVTAKNRPYTAGGKKRISQEYIYTLIPISSGLGVISPVRVDFLRKSDSRIGSVVSPQLQVTILLPEIIKDPSDSNLRVITFVLIGLFVLGAFVFIVLRKKRGQDIAQKNQLSEKQSRLDSALEALKTASSGTKAEFFDSLYEFLYALLRDGEWITARKGDSDSVLDELSQASLPEDTKRQLSAWLELSSHEKFSPGRGTPGETLRVYYEVESFMNEVWPAANQKTS